MFFAVFKRSINNASRPADGSFFNNVYISFMQLFLVTETVGILEDSMKIHDSFFKIHQDKCVIKFIFFISRTHLKTILEKFLEIL